MSAARAAARVKPVVVIKSGRHAQGAKAAATHTGALAGSDAVYDAAFRRAGLLRVLDLDELFAAAETLGRLRPFTGNRLAILTNGGGIGVLAVDRLVGPRRHARRAFAADDEPSSMRRCRRSGRRPTPSISPAMPIESRYAVALEALLDDPANDAILVMNVPTALASADRRRKIGGRRRAKASQHVRSSQSRCSPFGSAAAVLRPTPRRPSRPPAFPATQPNPTRSRGFMHLVRYREAIEALMATPPSLPEEFTPDVAAARRIIEGAVREGRTWLDPIEVTRLLGGLFDPDRAGVARARCR